MLPFTLDELNTAIADGRVTERQHPTLPLYIYNYSPEVQYSQKWDDVTLNCRGLILEEAGNIVARPWKKFFNLGQVNLPIQFDDPVEVMDKADGSLGILYPQVHPEGFDVTWAIATRGSFSSEQAQHATAVWKAKYGDILMPMFGYTLLFEIIYSGNRIVLDYGDMDDLILLGAVENATGYYLGPREAEGLFTDRNTKGFAFWTGPVVEVMPYKSISEALGHTDRKNAEGFVIRSHNFMVKLKQPDYLELHRLVTNASPRTVWEQLKAGKSKSQIVSAFPDEFHDYIAGMIDPLNDQFDARGREIMNDFFDVVNDVASRTGLMVNEPQFRKVFAKNVAKHPDRKYMFLLLDERSIRDVLWSELRPKSDLTT